MIRVFFFIIIATSYFFSSNYSLAVSDNFNVRVVVGGDTTSPTTPVITSAIPVATTQIDVTWSASVDDYLLSGYRVWRDGTQIATTTLTNFSDTGLLPDTLYTYIVDAFDSSSNFSSSSVAVSTTTLAITSTPTTTDTQNSTQGGYILQLSGLEILTAENSAQFNWNTNIPTQYILRWGQTSSYELGSVSSSLYQREHQTIITQLEPGTRYVYELIAISGYGFSKTISQGEFVTESTFMTDALPNVANFNAQVLGDDVSLEWINPQIDDFAYVRVLRSPFFYPQNSYDGALVYEGRGTSIIDKEALAKYSPQHYTIFVFNSSGAISSGAVARAEKLADITASSTTPGLPLIDFGDQNILLASSVFIEQQSVIQTLNSALTLQDNIPYSISVYVKSLPPHLKSIIASVQNPTNQRLSTSYLLKINKNGDRYEALIPAPDIVGQARLTLEIFDYQAETVRRISNRLTFVAPEEKPVIFPDNILWWGKHIAGYLAVIVLVFVLLWYWFFIRRRRRG